jgi:hypothetical protein
LYKQSRDWQSLNKLRTANVAEEACKMIAESKGWTPYIAKACGLMAWHMVINLRISRAKTAVSNVIYGTLREWVSQGEA